MTKVRIGFLTLAVGVAAMLGWQAVAQNKSDQIGALIPLSGPNSEYGNIYQSGMELAVDHVRQDKSLPNGVKVVYEDSQALPQHGIVGFNKLANVVGVSCVLSAWTSVSKAIAPIATRTNVLALNGAAISPELAGISPMFLSILPLVTSEVDAILPYATGKLGLKKIAIIYQDDPTGNAVFTAFKREIGKAGGQLVEEFPVQPGAQQFGSLAAKVRESKPDAVFISSTGNQLSQIIKQLRDNGVQQQLIGYSPMLSDTVIAMPEAEGAIFTTQKFQLNASDPMSKRFVEGYRQKYNRDPNVFAANYYNGVMLYAQLASEILKRGEQVSGKSLVEQAHRFKKVNFVGGTVEFNADNTVKSPIQINQIKDKKITSIE
jgi:branched-chain amino acid transport system substrate-binding protein